MKKWLCVLLTAALLAGCTAAPAQTTAPSEEQAGEVLIRLSDEGVTFDGEGVHTANDIIYYEEGHDLTYGEGEENDSHSAAEAAEHTVVQVDDFDLSRLAEASREALIDILSDIPDYCTLIFVFDTVPFQYDGRQKKLKEALEKCTEVEFCRQSQRELNNWIKRHFQTHNKVIDDRECEYLTFVTGGTMTALGSEITKLAAYASGQQITRADIDAVVEPVLDAEVFSITDAISEGDYGLALQKLRTLLKMQQEPILLLAAIGGQFRRMLWARRVMSAGQGEGTLGEMLKSATGKTTHPFVLQKTMTAARRVPDDFCETAMKLCLETDLRLKSFSSDAQRELELLLLQLAQEVRK